MASSIQGAREAFAGRSWREAFVAFSAAAEQHDLAVADHERRAISAYLVGEDEAAAAAWEAAFQSARGSGLADEAARHAFWLALCLLLRGQPARAGGWLSRSERILEEVPDCVARGYVLIPKLVQALHAGDGRVARDLAVRAMEAGDRFDEADLRAFGLLGLGQALIATGDTAEGLSRLDEVMASVTAGEVGPITTGLTYCAVILECMELLELHRAAEWTQALSAWCEEQPDLVPYRGQCLIHRSQLAQASGRWSEAIETVHRALDRLTHPPHPALGLAHYQEAELHRLAGAHQDAAAAYRAASRHGHDPMPGLALLALAQGDVDAAAAGISRALDGTPNPTQRAPLLAAAVDIRRERGDVPGARAAADELVSIARSRSSEVLDAMAAQAQGAVLATEGDPHAALATLTSATEVWQRLSMPYEAARTTVLFGLACAMHGDRTSAALAFTNARDTFVDLGARPDLARLDRLMPAVDDERSSTGPTLSPREHEVLEHVAAGETNRAIAAALVISEHTVGRHLENIYAKLGVSSRAAATAYAYEHQLL